MNGPLGVLRPIDLESRLDASIDAPLGESAIAILEGMIGQLEGGMRHPAMPTVWIQSARRHPPLARGILHSQRGRSFLHRIQEFAERPHWQPVCDYLRQEPLLTSTHAIFSAQLARRIASEIPDGHPEETFWRALSVSIDRNPVAPFERLLHQQPVDACRALAEMVLTVASRPSESAPLEGDECRWLADAERSIDVDRWVREAQELLRQPTSDESEEDRRRLIHYTELLASRQESHWQEILFKVATVPSVREKMEVSAGLLQEWFGLDWAVWMPTRDAGAGLARWVLPNKNGSMLGFNGPRSHFESQALPARFRAARTILSSRQDPVARLYRKSSGCPKHLRPWLAKWADALAASVVGPSAVPADAPADSTARNFENADDEWAKMVAEFSAGAGHEINNPLGAIGGHASFLLKAEGDPDRRHALAQIQTQVGRIKRMINDLQIVGGNYARDVDRVAVDVILADALMEAEKRSPGGNASVQLGTDISLPGDRRWLARMLAEIILNGIQAAGPSGSVCVSAQKTQGDRGVEFVVTDSGRGFSAHDRRRAFLPFFSGRQAGRGLGMGLPVAQRIARDHRGIVFIDFGLPTTVRVRLPLD